MKSRKKDTPVSEYVRKLVHEHADGFSDEIWRIRCLASEQLLKDVPTSLAMRNNQAAARISMLRACGKWMTNNKELYGEERASKINTKAGAVALYASYAVSYYCTHHTMPDLPKKLSFLEGIDFRDLAELGKDCVTTVTIANEEMCVIPDEVKKELNDPVTYRWAMLISEGFAQVENERTK